MQKMRWLVVLCVVLLCVVLAGCQPVEPVNTDTSTPSSTPTTPVTTPPPTETQGETTPPTATATPTGDDLEALYKSAEDKVMPHIEAALAKLEEDRRDDLSKQNFPPEEREPAYEGLDDEQKALYDEMLPKIKGLEYFEYSAEEYGYDTLDNVFVAWSAMADDNLEINNYFLIGEKFEGDMTTALYSLYIQPGSLENEPAVDMAKLRDDLNEFEFACNIIVENMPQQASAYDKYRYLAYVLSYGTEYDYDSVGGILVGNSYGGILGGLSICQGYSEAMQYLCDRAGLWCRMVEGSSRDVSHAWNLVMLEEGTYHIDVTWSDESMETGDEGWMRYFMLTQQQILEDHVIDSDDEATGTVEFVDISGQ